MAPRLRPTRVGSGGQALATVVGAQAPPLAGGVAQRYVGWGHTCSQCAPKGPGGRIAYCHTKAMGGGNYGNDFAPHLPSAPQRGGLVVGVGASRACAAHPPTSRWRMFAGWGHGHLAPRSTYAASMAVPPPLDGEVGVHNRTTHNNLHPGARWWCCVMGTQPAMARVFASVPVGCWRAQFSARGSCCAPPRSCCAIL